MKINNENSSNYNCRSKSEELRDAYMEMFREMPTKYHLTLTFKFGVNERSAEGALKKFLIHLNRAILKNRYSVYDQCLQGFAIKESTPSMHNVHFHLMIADAEGKLPDWSRMNELVDKHIKSTNSSLKKNDQISKCMLQDYYRGSGSSLEQYLTKIFERRGIRIDEKINAICPLEPDSVSFH